MLQFKSVLAVAVVAMALAFQPGAASAQTGRTKAQAEDLNSMSAIELCFKQKQGEEIRKAKEHDARYANMADGYLYMHGAMSNDKIRAWCQHDIIVTKCHNNVACIQNLDMQASIYWNNFLKNQAYLQNRCQLDGIDARTCSAIVWSPRY